uniref:Zinc finger protein 785 n=1 Tax=Equus asinus TaxID=9793 RepID=A0A9L0IHS3_EQUAS
DRPPPTPSPPKSARLCPKSPGPLSFADVAAYCSPGQRGCLRPALRALCRDVMRKTYGHLGALGEVRRSGPKLAFISWVEGEVEAWGPEAQDPKADSPAKVAGTSLQTPRSSDGSEEKEVLKKSPKQKQMEHEGVSLKEWLLSSAQSPINPWLKDTPTRRPPYSCPDCGCNFSYPSLLARHKRVHSGQRPLPCNHCQAHFSQRKYLLQHQFIHTGEKPYPCPDCGRRFCQRASLAIQRRAHAGEKPYPRPDCKSGFTYPYLLAVCQRKHTGKKPYSSPTCSLRFACEKLYPCPDCGLHFTYSSLLLGHQHIHSDSWPHPCPKYGKCVKCKYALEAHQWIHRSGERLRWQQPTVGLSEPIPVLGGQDPPVHFWYFPDIFQECR